MGADSQDRIEEEHSLASPFDQVAVIGFEAPQVIVKLPENIDQGGRRRAAGTDGKAHSVGLALAVVGILAQDHCPHASKRCLVKGVKEILRRRIDRPGPVFLLHKGEQVPVIWF